MLRTVVQFAFGSFLCGFCGCFNQFIWVFVFCVMEQSVLWASFMFVVCFCRTSDILRYGNLPYMHSLRLVINGERSGFNFGAGFPQPLSLLKRQ